eukprot:CAMPEP_0204545786 /NCGR_PEP_ID=MMETSP0661-20131031/21534_1 /ASSEMBLY_ACC=CAM_ASM_000606 /TAXON_ID=109239 /ORGANISM="Alexandrium margalefi, Strain AMGDE01CS-322" /LENGTH=51 /DNA_ID=CAMNT_0051552585 /DNA_START=9 /DNA_END=161 /DNA_ORIENTATION=+
MAPVPFYWRRSPKSGMRGGASEGAFVELEADAKSRFQFFFDITHKATDNWT